MSKPNKRAGVTVPANTLIAAGIAAIAGFATVYLSFAPHDNARGPQAVGQASDAAGGEASKSDEEVAISPLAGLNKGAMAAFLVRPKPLDLPNITLATATGDAKNLADWKGKIVLLNIWATWCVPCRQEMPALDKLETELGGDQFQVVAVNIDKGGPDKAKTFLEETGATHLALYTDPTGKLFVSVKTVGMPTTLLIDRDGKEIGRLIGPADWASADAKRLIEAAIAAGKRKAG